MVDALTVQPDRRDLPPVSVVIGASSLEPNVHALAALVNAAYGHHRVGVAEMRHRLTTARNRVLHVALRDGRPVGCCSSTLHVPWCGPGCGHWGLLAVAPEAQGTGVASALVAAAEQRLASHGISHVQMEYSYSKGEAFSERMLAWYEDTLGYRGPASRYSGFRMCRKRLPGLDPSGGHAGCVQVLFKWFFAILLWACCGRY